jgi:hypothetical protein
MGKELCYTQRSIKMRISLGGMNYAVCGVFIYLFLYIGDVGKEFAPSFSDPWSTYQPEVHFPEGGIYNLKNDQQRKIKIETYQPNLDST